jgi:uncharacterized protein YecT (DUF1311 family)
MRSHVFAVLIASSPVFASGANSQTIDAAKRCETIQDKQSRVACFAQAGVPVIDCARPRDADEAAFCQNLAGSPNSTSASTARPATAAPVPITPAQPIAATEVRIVPRGDEKPSFDCAQAKAAAARLICADAELAQLDGELGVAFQKQKAQISAPDQAKLTAEQLTWIRDRNTRCELVGKNSATIDVLAKSKACMVSAIQERIVVLARTKSTVTVGCHRDGDVVTIQGVATAQSLKLANGSVQNVWLLVTDRPICLLESPNGVDAPLETSVFRIQIIGQAPPSDTALELTGKLSTGNISQYYAEPTAINVISGHRIAAPSPPSAPLDSPKFDANQVAVLLDKRDGAAASSQVAPTMPSVAASGSPTIPNAESLLIAAVEKARAAYAVGTNDMARGAARPARARDICAVLNNFRVSNWAGKVETLSSNSDGLGVLSVQIAEGVSIKTWNNALSDTAYQTLIDPGSPVFKLAVTLKEGQQITFGGQFFPDPTDCVKESSLTLKGSLTEPEFIFRFSNIAPVE